MKKYIVTANEIIQRVIIVEVEAPDSDTAYVLVADKEDGKIIRTMPYGDVEIEVKNVVEA